jgi:AraC family transcriptional regulator, transcriptional activator FtrA
MPKNPLVAILAYDGLCTFEYGIAFEVFGLKRPEMGDDWYRCVTVAVEDGPLRTSSGLTMLTQASSQILQDADLIIVPGWRGINESVPVQLVEQLKSAHKRGTRVASLCSGIVLIAEANLVQGRTVTTHWRYAEAVQTRFPDIKIDASILYADHGDILTAAGSAAGIDLCLHIVRKDFGSVAANSVARRLVVQPLREGGQQQFIEAPVQQLRVGKPLSNFIDQLRGSLDRAHTIESMASAAGMSTRSFQRLFTEMTGMAPADWLAQERVITARTLLETTHQSLEEVAFSVGFGSLETFRHQFSKRTGLAPASYRKRFLAN